jgi:hypothetical protein
MEALSRFRHGAGDAGRSGTSDPGQLREKE